MSNEVRSGGSYSRTRRFQRSGSSRRDGSRFSLPARPPAAGPKRAARRDRRKRDPHFGHLSAGPHFRTDGGPGVRGPNPRDPGKRRSCNPGLAVCSSPRGPASAPQRRTIAADRRMTGPGGVAEWSKALVLKTSEPRGSVGSNPTPTANQSFRDAEDPFSVDRSTASCPATSPEFREPCRTCRLGLFGTGLMRTAAGRERRPPPDRHLACST